MSDVERMSKQELEAEGGSALPDKEVVSLLDVGVDLDLGLDLAAPVDLAVAGNANAAIPIDAAVAANVVSIGSDAEALADQDAAIIQSIDADATAHADQDSVLDQSNDVVDGGTVTDTPDASLTDPSTALSGGLLNLDVDAALDADLAAPINGAVALNANVAAPVDAAVGANVLSIDSQATAIADQDVLIEQNIDGEAEAIADQDSELTQ
jgi:hypothetical protein